MTKLLKYFYISISVLLIPLTEISAYSFNQESGLDTTAGGTGHQDIPLFSPDNLPGIIGKIIGVILSFLGVIFLLLMIYGGYLWMMARGNEEQVGKAKKIIVQAVIGVIIVLAAYAITAFIGTQLN